MSVHDSFPCSDCKGDFPTAEAFSDHFSRLPGSTIITGCKPIKGEKGERVEREA